MNNCSYIIGNESEKICIGAAFLKKCFQYLLSKTLHLNLVKQFIKK